MIPDMTQIVQIAAGENHVLALNITGQVFAWGSNDYGQVN
jgi:alpha-tubulin suppressor-like RCC1 family protein